MFGAWLAGPTRAATALRRELSPYVRDHRGTAYEIAGALYLALIAWAPIDAFRKAIGILLFAVLFALGTVGPAPPDRARVPGRAPRRARRAAPGVEQSSDRGHRGRRQAAPSAGRGGPALEDATLGQLERPTALRDCGALTEEEFSSAKAAVIGSA